jgi:hypothetical protein
MKSKSIITFLFLSLYCLSSEAQSLLEDLKSLSKVAAFGYVDSKTDNALSDLIGTWSKYQFQYPNGRKEYVSYDQRIRITILPNVNSSSIDLLSYSYYLPDQSEAYECGVSWFNQGRICFGKVHNSNSTGLEYKFGYDDRGLKCLMIKARIYGNEEVWIIYRKEL